MRKKCRKMQKGLCMTRSCSSLQNFFDFSLFYSLCCNKFGSHPISTVALFLTLFLLERINIIVVNVPPRLRPKVQGQPCVMDLKGTRNRRKSNKRSIVSIKPPLYTANQHDSLTADEYAVTNDAVVDPSSGSSSKKRKQGYQSSRPRKRRRSTYLSPVLDRQLDGISDPDEHCVTSVRSSLATINGNGPPISSNTSLDRSLQSEPGAESRRPIRSEKQQAVTDPTSFPSRRRRCSSNQDEGSPVSEEQSQRPRRPNQIWSKDQSQLLLKLYNDKQDLDKVAENFPGRTKRQCSQQYSRLRNTKPNEKELKHISVEFLNLFCQHRPAWEV